MTSRSSSFLDASLITPNAPRRQAPPQISPRQARLQAHQIDFVDEYPLLP